MLIDLRFEIACSADTAWEAIHSPAVAAALYGSVLQLHAQSPLPERFADGDSVEVELRFAGRVPVGRQVIRIRDEVHGAGKRAVRTMHDIGRPLSGPLAMLHGWHHRMTITSHEGENNRAIWRDRLTVSGPGALLVWPVLWATWHWRAARIRRAAPGWTARHPAHPGAGI